MILHDESGVTIMSGKAILKAAKQREQAEQRDAKSIAGMFAEALGCIEDAVCHLERIDGQYNKRYPNDGCEDLELSFWWAVAQAFQPLRDVRQKLEAVASLVPKEKIR